jgi:hypothetical protein
MDNNGLVFIHNWKEVQEYGNILNYLDKIYRLRNVF